MAKTHVQAPTDVVFLCGGRTSDIGDTKSLSLRDAFLKIYPHPAIDGKDLLQAEDVTVLSIFDEHYSDLLQFETDLAQVTELVLLFCESEGSLAELGAFSMVDEIAQRLLVVIREKYWKSESFVRFGPLRALEKRYGHEYVYVLDDVDINIVGESFEKVDLGSLRDRLHQPIVLRLKKRRELTTFKGTSSGHRIKLAVGLIQEYGALTVDELVSAFGQLGLEASIKSMAAYMLCAEIVKWVSKTRKGSSTFYVARAVPDAATSFFSDNVATKSKTRRRLDIREHWRKNDPLRHRAITEVVGPGRVI